MDSLVARSWDEEEGFKRDRCAPTNLLENRALVVAGLGSSGGPSWGTHDLPLDGRITGVARVRMYGPFVPLLLRPLNRRW